MSEQQSNSYTEPSNFTIVQNELIRSSSLSCKAFKLLCIGLSHSGKWTFVKSQIATCFKEGMHTVDEAMKELRDLGYLHLKAKKGDDNNFTGHQWFWFKRPVTEEEFKIFLGEGGFRGLQEIGDSKTIDDIRRPSSKKTKLEEKNNNNPPDPEASSIIIFSTFNELEIPEDLKIKLSSQMDEPKAQLLVKRVQAWKNRGSDALGCNTILSQWETWGDNIPKEDLVEKNRLWAQENLKLYNGKKLGGYIFHILSKYVEFAPIGAYGAKYFNYENVSFQEKVKSFLGENTKKLKKRCLTA